MISVIYFDLGGVTFYDFFSGGEREMAEYIGTSADRVRDAYVKTDLRDYSLGKISDIERWNLFADEIGIHLREINPLIEVFYNSYRAVDSTVGLLRHLKAQFPNLKRGIISDQPDSVVRMLRKRHDEVISLFDDEFVLISAEVGLSKRDTDPGIFKLALERSKVGASQIMYVDDSVSHLRNASKVGIRGFHFDITRRRPLDLVEQIKTQIANG